MGRRHLLRKLPPVVGAYDTGMTQGQSKGETGRKWISWEASEAEMLAHRPTQWGRVLEERNTQDQPDGLLTEAGPPVYTGWAPRFPSLMSVAAS